eukprot:TRINITY_DN120824_c0_g1_i1.p2 TRINITY_DN120824_c0_g1~~TRINITY_DN120824_c0_g1_i1.p2  ORF type:complete len:241 (+),score=27.35 TRINITY_DN120824_c0_g1_i1:165-887(+)
MLIISQMAKYALPKLAYEFSALEPVLSRTLVDIHYNKHHLNYVNTLNAAMEQYNEAIAKNDLPKIVALQPTIAFNGGSHINHSLYWENLAPAATIGGKLPPAGSPLHERIVQDWGSFDKMMEYFVKRTTGIKGSGWGWLVLDKITKKTSFMETHDQDAVEMVSPDKAPLLGVDIWEHAFYLDYKNVKAEYMKNIWKIINWEVVQKRYAAACIQAWSKAKQPTLPLLLRFALFLHDTFLTL